MPQTILLVEDDDILREALAFNLSRQGYEVREASEGQQAIDEARRTPPDLIILDVMLPGLDGLSVCRILRAEMATPIILLTARTGDVDKIVGLESGADDYVTKPFNTGELLARIRAVMRRTGQASAGLPRGARVDPQPQRVRPARRTDAEPRHCPLPRPPARPRVGL
jgi:DNA-binding response OmpR family regulator